MNKNKSLSMVKTLVLALLATGVFSGLASAQVIEGKFTLPCATYWGGAILPAGDYSFSLGTSSLPALITVRGRAKGGRAAMINAQATSQTRPSERSSLTLVRRGEQAIVRSMYLAELGVAFSYSAPRGQTVFLAQGPELIQRVAVSTSASGK